MLCLCFEFLRWHEVSVHEVSATYKPIVPHIALHMLSLVNHWEPFFCGEIVVKWMF